MRKFIGLGLAFGLAPLASAGLFTIADGNSSADVDANFGQMYNWFVDGTDHLFDQEFFYRAGAAGSESPVGSLALLGAAAFNTNLDPRNDTLNAIYGGAGFTVDVTYRISGGLGGSNTADIAEQIRINNLTGAPLPFSFFQYCDFDLMGTAGGDTVFMPLPNTAQQSEGAFVMSETVVTPMPSGRQVDGWPNILASLADLGVTNLNGFAGPLGPGDMTWAFQWDFVIGANSSVLISKDKLITPEPASLLLIALGGAALLRRR